MRKNADGLRWIRPAGLGLIVPGEGYCGKLGETQVVGLLFVAELVTNSPNGQDHLGVLGVLFNLGSETIDM